MSKILKSDLPKEFRAQIEAERDRLMAQGQGMQAEMDHISARIMAIDTLLAAYAPPVRAPEVLLLAPPEKKKRKAGTSKTKSVRPDKSNLEMMVEALRKTKQSMSGVELRTWVRDNIWADCPDGFASAPFGYIDDGRLIKDGSKFKLPPSKGESLPVKAAPRPPLEPPAPPPKPKPAPAAQAAPASDAMTRKTFLHNGNGALLSSKHWRLAERLQKTMGKGYLPHKVAATVALGTDYGGDAKAWLRGEQPIVNSALATIGLTMVIEEAGVFMREAS